MRQLVFVAVAGLCSVSPALAQEGGYLAPTSPVVPAPALPTVTVAPTGGTPSSWKTGAAKSFTAPKWEPMRNPVIATSGADAPATAAPVTPAAPATAPLPAMPAGVVMPYGGSCVDGSCGREHRSCAQQLKAWLCFQYSRSDLPKCQPTPYITPLHGMFPCQSGCGVGCGAGCAPGVVGGPVLAPGAVQPAPAGTPIPEPASPKATPLPVPKPLPPSSGAGPVEMPPRGATGGAFAPAWRVQPTLASATPAVTAAGSWRPALPTPVGAGQK